MDQLREALSAAVIDFVADEDAFRKADNKSDEIFLDSFLKCFDLLALDSVFRDEKVGGTSAHAETDAAIFELLRSRFSQYYDQASEKLKGVAAAFDSLLEVAQNSQPHQKRSGLSSVLWAFSLLRLCEHDGLTEKTKYFELLSQVKDICTELQNSLAALPPYWQALSSWANALAFLLQARKINTERKETETIRTLIIKKVRFRPFRRCQNQDHALTSRLLLPHHCRPRVPWSLLKNAMRKFSIRHPERSCFVTQRT
jgi:hypothetical protein